MDEVAKFWACVVKGETEESCWGWTCTHLPAGYGIITKQTKVNGKWVATTIYAHRLSYEIHEGAIPAGHYVMHSCDNPSCANPRHLIAGVPQDNVDDMIAKGRHPNIPAKPRLRLPTPGEALYLQRVREAAYPKNAAPSTNSITAITAEPMTMLSYFSCQRIFWGMLWEGCLQAGRYSSSCKWVINPSALWSA